MKLHFLRNKPSLIFALLFILMVVIVAIFAYPLAKDKSPNANRMIVELAAKPIGFEIELLKIPKTVVTDRHNFLSEIFLGTPERYDYVPIKKIWKNGDKVSVLHYIDDGIVDTLSYDFKQLGISEDTSLANVVKKSVVNEKFWLGTDRNGRDIYSRILIGSRVSMAVGLVSVILSITLGIIMGSLSGWYGGFIDSVVMYVINILWAIPTLLLVFAITITLGKGFWEIFIAIGITSWVGAARLIRGQVMQVKNMDYITAAKALGYSDFRIIVKHILPNIAGPIMVIAATNFAAAILVEAGLSFLGIGVQPPTPSWGLMIKEHYNFLIAGKPFIALIPGIAISLLVLSFNILGNSLRDYIDVRK